MCAQASEASIRTGEVRVISEPRFGAMYRLPVVQALGTPGQFLAEMSLRRNGWLAAILFCGFRTSTGDAKVAEWNEESDAEIQFGLQAIEHHGGARCESASLDRVGDRHLKQSELLRATSFVFRKHIDAQCRAEAG